MLQGSRWMATIILAFQAIGVVYGASPACTLPASMHLSTMHSTVHFAYFQRSQWQVMVCNALIT